MEVLLNDDKQEINQYGCRSKKYIGGNVALQLCALAANILVMIVFAKILSGLAKGAVETRTMQEVVLVVGTVLTLKCICTTMASQMSYLSSREVKKLLREMIYRKLLRLGSTYREKIQTSEIVQVAVEGVAQLETTLVRIFRNFSMQY